MLRWLMPSVMFIRKERLEAYEKAVENADGRPLALVPDLVVEVLRRIHAQGILLSLDDFGTGYSSLSYLKLLPLDILKIDRSFINDIGGEQSDEAILESIISLSRNLNLRVVAEGVETQEQLQFLRRLNCHSIQGYYISEPKSPADIEELLHNIKDGNLLPIKIPVKPTGLILQPKAG